MSSQFYKIKDKDNLIKNIDNSAVLNVDNESLNKYRDEREKLMKLSNVVTDNERLSREVAEVKQTLSEILDLLRNKA